MEDKYDYRKYYSRQVGKLPPDVANKLNFDLAKIFLPYKFPASEGYTFDLTECFVIGDIKIYKDGKFYTLIESECRRPDQYIKIYNYSWNANIIQKNGHKDKSKISLKHNLQNESEPIQLLYFIFDQDEAIDCVEQNILPKSYVSFNYDDRVRNLKFKLESSVDANGETFWEFKAKLPYKLAFRNTLNDDNTYIQESYAEYVENI
jgi:hypothetical protein